MMQDIKALPNHRIIGVKNYRMLQ